MDNICFDVTFIFCFIMDSSTSVVIMFNVSIDDVTAILLLLSYVTCNIVCVKIFKNEYIHIYLVSFFVKFEMLLFVNGMIKLAKIPHITGEINDTSYMFAVDGIFLNIIFFIEIMIHVTISNNIYINQYYF